MHVIEIPDAKITKYVPSDLSECTSKQYIDICGLIFLYQTQQITHEDFKVQAVYKLLDIKPSDAVLTEEEDLQKWVNIVAISNLLDSFFEENQDGQKVIKQYYIHNPVPKISLFKTYFGPADQFKNITFWEYTDALRLFHDFSYSGDIELLYLIAAIFYRPAKPFHFITKNFNNYNGDIRVDYNPHKIEARAKQFKNLPIGFIYGVYFLFASYQKFISTNKIVWGGKEIDLSIIFTSDEKQEKLTEHESIGMDSVMFSMVQSGVFGNKKETMQTNNWELLVRMYDLRVQDLEKIKLQEKHDKSANT